MVLLSFLKQTSPFVRFLFVGFINTFIGLSTIFIMMYKIDVSYWGATFIGNSVGAIVSFLLNRTFTFNSKISYRSGGVRFLIVILFCYFFSYSISDLIANFLQELPLKAQIIYENDLAVLIGTALYTITNYLGQKWIVFFRESTQ